MGTIGLVQTVLGILLLGVGMVACVLMLEVLGRPGRAEDPSGKRAVHRLLGRVFVVLYAILFVWMLPKAAYYPSQNEPYTIRVFAHVLLALSMLPLLAIKVAIVKRYKSLMQSTPWLGILIVSLVYIVVSLTAGHEVVGMLKSFR